MKDLRNKKVLITREKSQAKSLTSLIERFNGKPIVIPLIAIDCIKNYEIDLNKRNYEWIFFTSVNGVHCFMKQYSKNLTYDYRIAAVGHKTARIIEQYGYQVDFIPSTYNAETMVKEFLQQYPNSDHFLIVRGNISRNVLLDAFRDQHLLFEPIVVYETKPNVSAKQLLIDTFINNRPDYLTFTSPSTVNTFVSLLEGTSFLEEARNIPTVCIGTTTENAAKSYQFLTLITPKTFTIEAMVNELLKFEMNRIRKNS